MDKKPIGLFWKKDASTYDEEQRSRNDGRALVHEDISNVDISMMLNRFR